MAVRKIFRMGNPQLHVRSVPVAEPTSDAIRLLIADMKDTLESVDGIGLAAPQIGVPERVVLFCLPPSRIPAGARTAPIPWTAMINPTIEPLDDSRILLWERCLSLPGLYAKVPRHGHTVVRYVTPEGEAVVRECRGYLSALLQHECDHLDGTLYPQRLEDPRHLSYASEVGGGGAVYHYSPDEFDGVADIPSVSR